MGAGLTIAQGLLRIEPERTLVAFIGDSTFFHTGIPGVINAVYNQYSIKIIVLDNSTTAMTGHQPHPGTGKNAGGLMGTALDLVAILTACGVQSVETVNPLELKAAEAAVHRALEFRGVAAVVMRAPCANTFRPARRFRIARELCSDCGLCLRELGCPAFFREAGDQAGIQIGPACYGCGLCGQICPKKAIIEM
jgi:indolepyruvate ferredoxin oxidoreductase alpha subunit